MSVLFDSLWVIGFLLIFTDKPWLSLVCFAIALAVWLVKCADAFDHDIEEEEL